MDIDYYASTDWSNRRKTNHFKLEIVDKTYLMRINMNVQIIINNASIK